MSHLFCVKGLARPLLSQEMDSNTLFNLGEGFFLFQSLSNPNDMSSNSDPTSWAVLIHHESIIHPLPFFLKPSWFFAAVPTGFSSGGHEAQHQAGLQRDPGEPSLAGTHGWERRRFFD